MVKRLSEEKLRQQAVRVLSDSLGPVDALRFLALVSREPFDYEHWRKQYFRTTTGMNCSRNFGATAAEKSPERGSPIVRDLISAEEA
jgi:hypothetical protein